MVLEPRSTYTRLAYFPDVPMQVIPVRLIVAWVATGAERHVRPTCGCELFVSSVLSAVKLGHTVASLISASRNS